MFEEVKDKSQIYALINTIAIEHNLLKKLRLTHILLHSIDDDVVKSIKCAKYHAKLQEIFKDADFMQQLQLNCQLKEHPMAAIEYYGKDYYGQDPNLQYQPRFEEIMQQIISETDEMLGKIIKEYAKTEGGLEMDTAIED